jgi:prepilin-type N-terminal cleavage/methylation domain-containing protein
LPERATSERAGVRRIRSGGARTRAAARARAGLTLIEIMLVVVIIGLGASAASFGIGTISRTNLRSACVKLMSMSRYAYHRALTNGTTVRLTLDFSRNSVAASEAFGRISLVRSDAPLRERAARDDDDEGDEVRDPGAGVDAWELAKARLEKPDELVFPPSPFEPLRTPSGKPMERFKTQRIGDGIRLHKVIVAHEAEHKTEGVTDLFFFPSGLTQHAVVQLADKSDTIFSVEVHPLTGKGKVHDTPFEPEVLMDDPNERNERASQLEERL